MLTVIEAAKKAHGPLLFLTVFFHNSIKSRIKLKRENSVSSNKPNDVQVMLSCNINGFVVRN